MEWIEKRYEEPTDGDKHALLVQAMKAINQGGREIIKQLSDPIACDSIGWQAGFTQGMDGYSDEKTLGDVLAKIIQKLDAIENTVAEVELRLDEFD